MKWHWQAEELCEHWSLTADELRLGEIKQTTEMFHSYFNDVAVKAQLYFVLNLPVFLLLFSCLNYNLVATEHTWWVRLQHKLNRRFNGVCRIPIFWSHSWAKIGR